MPKASLLLNQVFYPYGNSHYTSTNVLFRGTFKDLSGDLRLGLTNGKFLFGGLVHRAKGETFNSSDTSVAYE